MAAVNCYNSWVENDDSLVESDDSLAENDDSLVENDDSLVENDDSWVESVDSWVENGRARATCEVAPLKVKSSLLIIDSVERLTGLQPQDLMERSLYHCIHPCDVLHMRRAHNIRKWNVCSLVACLLA